MVRPVLGALAGALVATAAGAQPWTADILPPAPAWKGKSERLIVPASDPWITPSEKTGLTETPSYEETRAFLERLDAASPLIKVIVFGRSPHGREMIAVIASKEPLDGPSISLAIDKPLLLAQAGIHAGEIDGKDAGLMLLRDIALRGKDGLLDKANLLFVPMFNPDGHERVSAYSRPNQRGPLRQGWRTNAQNLNLNRDYMKLDLAETQAMIGLINRFQPSLYLDLHVTDGVDYAYDITYGFEGGGADPARSKAIAAWLNGVYRPKVDKALSGQGHIPGDLVFAVDDRNMKAGLFNGAGQPRFSNSYGDLRRLPSVLVENHSLKPYRQRVLGTYILLEASLRALGSNGAQLRRAVDADRAERPGHVPTAYVPDTTPRSTIAFKAIASEMFPSPASGRDEVRWLGRSGGTVNLPVYGSKPAVMLDRPAAYWVPATKPEVIQKLGLHGVAMETQLEPRTVEVEMVRIGKAALKPQPFEGRMQIEASGFATERRQETYPVGSVRVPTDQPLGELAMLLLEPQSDDSFFAWGFFPEIMQRTEYIEGYAIAPLAEKMLAGDPGLKAEFEAKLAADPGFAKNPDARLSWFYARTPYYDERHLLYPVGRETK